MPPFGRMKEGWYLKMTCLVHSQSTEIVARLQQTSLIIERIAGTTTLATSTILPLSVATTTSLLCHSASLCIMLSMVAMMIVCTAVENSKDKHRISISGYACGCTCAAQLLLFSFYY